MPQHDPSDWIKPISDFQLTRQDLPHMQLPGSYYFSASNTHRRQILPPLERQIVFDAIRFHRGTKYDLDAAVVMPDHFHLIFRPLDIEGGAISLPEIFHSIKSYSAHRIAMLRRDQQLIPTKSKIVVWQDENFDHIIRNDRDYYEKLRYLVMNPVEAGLVERPEDYPYLYCPSIGKH